MQRYRIVYLDPSGGYIDTIYKFVRLEYNRNENKIGSLTLDLPPIYPAGFFKVDGRLEVYVKDIENNAEYLDGETQYFIRLVREKTDEQKQKTIHILAHDAIDILDRRVVPYASETAYCKKTNHAELMIKEIMRENFGASATDTNRDITAWMTIQADFNQTTVDMTKTFAYQKVLPLIQDICDESRDENNEYLCFDVVRVSEKLLQFRTYIGQRGSNRGMSSPSPLIFSYENLGLSYSSIAFDSSEERNFIYAGGQGERDDRVIKTAANWDRIGLSPFNRFEDFFNASHNETADAVQSDANAQLAKMAAKISFNGHIMQRQKLIFGVHYNFGDIVVAKIGDHTFDVHLTGFSRLSEEGKSETTIFARSMEDSL